LLLMSILYSPMKFPRPNDPPKELKDALTGEKAIQLSQIPVSLVVGPNTTLIERVVFCKLKGLTATCIELDCA